jgi:hypothetical protein
MHLVNLGQPGLLHRRDRQVQDTGDEPPGVVVGQGDTGSGGHVGRDENGVLDVRPHGPSRFEGCDRGTSRVQREAERTGNVVSSTRRCYGANQAAGSDDWCLGWSRQ